MSEFNLQKQNAIIYSMLEDSVNFEVEQLENINGKGILAFIKDGKRSVMAINDMYLLGLLDYIEKGTIMTSDYDMVNLDFLADYIVNKYPLRAKIQDFLTKIQKLLKD